jgi:hypothetical protein
MCVYNTWFIFGRWADPLELATMVSNLAAGPAPDFQPTRGKVIKAAMWDNLRYGWLSDMLK